MLWPFGKLKEPERFLGVDIGTTSIKIVELIKSQGAAQLTNYAILETYSYLERVNTALQTSGLKLFEKEATNYLRQIIGQAGFQARSGVAALPSFSVFTTVIDVPPMPESELQKTLPFKARQYIPMPVATVALDWLRTGDNQVLLMAVPNEQIERYQTIFKEAALGLTAVETEGWSLARALTSDSDYPILIIDIGSRSTGFFVGQQGLLKLQGQSDFAGAAVTRALASGLGVNMERAEDLKKQRGLVSLGFGPEQELSTLMRPVLDVIISEAKRLAQNFVTTYGGEVKEVIVSGGGSALMGIEDYFSQEMERPVKKANLPPLLEPVRTEAGPLLKSLAPLLAVAVGAALRA